MSILLKFLVLLRAEETRPEGHRLKKGEKLVLVGQGDEEMQSGNPVGKEADGGDGDEKMEERDKENDSGGDNDDDDDDDDSIKDAGEIDDPFSDSDVTGVSEPEVSTPWTLRLKSRELPCRFGLSRWLQ